MRKFKFRFERILDIKRRNENQLRELWVRKDRAWREAVQEKQSIENQLAAARENLRSLQQQHPFPLFEVNQAHDHVASLKVRLSESQAKVEAALEARNEAEMAVRKAMQERRTFEILREKQFALFQQEENRREQQLMDEIGSLHASRLLSSTKPTVGMYGSGESHSLH